MCKHDDSKDLDKAKAWLQDVQNDGESPVTVKPDTYLGD